MRLHFFNSAIIANSKMRAENHALMFCFGLQSIARFINSNASYFNKHRLESEGKFS